MRESNSHQRFWRPLSYHLTNPLSKPTCKISFTVAIIHIKATIVKLIVHFYYKEFYKERAEMEGFEPSHRLPGLPHFECGPFSHLGTSPGSSRFYKESTERSILFLLTKWFCCNKIVIKCGCVHSGLLLSGDNKQLRGKQIGDDHDRKKENNSGGCGEADRYLP